MADNKTTYTRLPGRSKKRFGLFYRGGDRLWLAPDHLLYLQAAPFSERNKRFHLKDIQALVVTKTSAGRTMNILMGVLVGIFGLLYLASVTSWDWDIGGLILFGGFGGIFAVTLVINVILGPTCKCRLYTDVQVEELIPLGRFRTANRVVGILKPLIEATQGRLTPENLDAYSAERVELEASSHAFRQGVSSNLSFINRATDNKTELRHEHGKVHAGLFYMLLVMAITSFIDILYQSSIKNLIDTLLLVPFVLLMILALRRQGGTDLPSTVKGITWAALVVLIVFFIFGMFYGIAYGFSFSRVFGNISPLHNRYEGPVFVVYCTVGAIIFSVLGIMGLIRLEQFRSAYAASQPLSPAGSGLEGDR